ncbi:uncharacterized protein LOC110806821 [Carica papaya]|uniref:uncharacterized protein LOC110806821 n=1 Tax=Carica papaya TaxID=3649 RepID=UPI000B8CEB6F|nr:uncharacterized protein LOC110806821 [Carica papaya]
MTKRTKTTAKGANKRKTAPKEEPKAAAAASSSSSSSQAKPATRAVKRVKVEHQQEPEYFEDQRNLEDLWRAIYPVGTEWDQLDSLYDGKWSFSNLEVADVFYSKFKDIVVFKLSQLVFYKGENKVMCIPVVVAVASPFPPSDKIGINSVQREAEEIVPMKRMKMDWIPYIPLEKRGSQVDRLKSQIFILGCTQRRASLKNMKFDHMKKFEYCLPYFYHPFKEDEIEQSTEVQIIFPAEPKPVFCEFDWELDELEEFTDNLIKDEALAEDQKDAFKEFVKEKVREAKKANRQAKEARKKAIEEMSQETKQAFENMRFYKFYPVQTPDSPDISNVKVPFINRYYGKAHEVL